MQAQGKLIIFSAPSGSGKTTLVKHLLSTDLPLQFSISATSRPPRAGEVAGRDYYFLDEQDFQKKIETQEFLEWEEVYTGCFYGTLKEEVSRIWQAGKQVIFDMDVVGGLRLKRLFAESALAIFVMPPDLATLAQRLEARGTEGPEKIAQRLAKAERELARAQEFDHILINRDLAQAKAESEALVRQFLKPPAPAGNAPV